MVTQVIYTLITQTLMHLGHFLYPVFLISSSYIHTFSKNNTTPPSKLSLSPNNLLHHKMFMPRKFLTRYNHNQITHTTNFLFIMCHELSRIFFPFSIFRYNTVSIYSYIDCFLHFIGHDCTNHGATGCVTFVTGWSVDERPTWYGRIV